MEDKVTISLKEYNELLDKANTVLTAEEKVWIREMIMPCYRYYSVENKRMFEKVLPRLQVKNEELNCK